MKKRQLESKRENQIKEILLTYKVSSLSIEGKGSIASTPDILCYTEKGNIFLIELKDGSTYSPGQQYLLLRIKHNYMCEYEDGTFRFYKKIDKYNNNEITIEEIILEVDR